MKMADGYIVLFICCGVYIKNIYEEVNKPRSTEIKEAVLHLHLKFPSLQLNEPKQQK